MARSQYVATPVCVRTIGQRDDESAADWLREDRRAVRPSGATSDMMNDGGVAAVKPIRHLQHDRVQHRSVKLANDAVRASIWRGPDAGRPGVATHGHHPQSATLIVGHNVLMRAASSGAPAVGPAKLPVPHQSCSCLIAGSCEWSLLSWDGRSLSPLGGSWTCHCQ